MDALCDADEIVSLLQRRDLTALDRATRCYGDRLLAAARHYCRDATEADDAVQDALLGAWRYGEGLRGDGAVDRWLVRLVASACSRMRRGMKRNPAIHVTDVELAADETPEQLAARSQLAEDLASALIELDAVDRAIVILADTQGLTGPEIADALGMTAGAVRSRLSRAHRRLRDRLGPAHDPGADDAPSS